MYIKNREVVENLRIKANNCYIALDDYDLSDLKDSVLNCYTCSSILRNIILQEIGNIDELIDFLKRILIYQVKILEREQDVLEKDLHLETLEKELADDIALEANLEASGTLNLDVTIKEKIEEETIQINQLKQDIASSHIIIENMKSAFTTYRVPEGNTRIPYTINYYTSLEIDTATLESARNFVKYMSDKFKRDARDVYVNSDLTEFFEGYAYQTDRAYDKVLSCFRRMDSCLELYINDSSAIERALAMHIKPSVIRNSSILAILNKLPDLEEYNTSYTRIMNVANHNLQREKNISLDSSTKENKNQKLRMTIDKSGGVGHREAVVAAATYLAELGNVPYFYGGKSKALGVNSDWGSAQKIEAKGSKEQPNGSFHPYGLDATGFVEWSLNNGGYNASLDNVSSLKPLGDVLKFTKKNLLSAFVKAGDLLYAGKNHMAIITNIDKDKETITVAEERNLKEGLVVTKENLEDFIHHNHYDGIVLMEDYYSNKDNFKVGETSEN